MQPTSVHLSNASRWGASFSFLVAFVGLAAPLAHAQSFAPPVHYEFGTIPVQVAIGDFNGDGKSDLATANSAANNVSILLGNGDGTFAPKKNYGVGQGPNGVAISDFNSDGKSDLAVVNTFSSSVSVLLGKGDGTFVAQKEYTAGDNPGGIAVGDFDGDGKSDLAIAGFNSRSVSVLLGKGDGTFAPQKEYKAGYNPINVVVGDFNGDGKSDLVVTNGNQEEDGSVSILLGNGKGTFAAPVSYKTGKYPWWVVTGDFNGDGKSDLAVTNRNSHNVSTLLGKGDGTFTASKDYAVGENSDGVAVGDFNGDGKSDLVIASGSVAEGILSVLLGQGDGTFAAQKDFKPGYEPNSVAVGDFNSDGKSDLVVTSDVTGKGIVDDRLSVLINNG